MSRSHSSQWLTGLIKPPSTYMNQSSDSGVTNQTLASNLYEYTSNATEQRYYDSFDNTAEPNVFSANFANFTSINW